MKELFQKREPRLLLAPMRGVTDSTFRTVYATYFPGIDGAVSPFITSVKGRKIKTSHLKDILPENNPVMPVIPQILGKDADEFITLASAIADLGYKEVNWNLGCPYPMVANKGRGSGLLCFPEKVDRLLEIILPKIPVRLSIKMRLGRSNVKEAALLMPVFNRYALWEIIIHPRTGVQMYEGDVDLDGFYHCLKNSRHPVVYNGDINHVQDFKQLWNRFDTVRGWMLGRGVLVDPFLPGSIKGLSWGKEAKADLFIRFHGELFDQYCRKLYGPAHVLDRMKGLWRYFERGFHPNKKRFKKLRKATSLKQYRQTVDLLFHEEFQRH